MTHGREVCQHGIIHSQCRCMEGHKNVIRIRCDRNDEHRQMLPQVDVFQSKTADRDDQIAMLKETNEQLQRRLDRLQPSSELLTKLMAQIREL